MKISFDSVNKRAMAYKNVANILRVDLTQVEVGRLYASAPEYKQMNKKIPNCVSKKDKPSFLGSLGIILYFIKAT